MAGLNFVHFNSELFSHQKPRTISLIGTFMNCCCPLGLIYVEMDEFLLSIVILK